MIISYIIPIQNQLISIIYIVTIIVNNDKKNLQTLFVKTMNEGAIILNCTESFTLFKNRRTKLIRTGETVLPKRSFGHLMKNCVRSKMRVTERDQQLNLTNQKRIIVCEKGKPLSQLN